MYLPPASASDLAQQLAGIPRPDGQPLFVMLAEQEAPVLDALVEALNAHGVPFFGGVFPGVLFDNQSYNAGAVALPLPLFDEVHLIHGLDAPQPELPAVLEADRYQDVTPACLVVVDGLASNVASFLEALGGRLGRSVAYIGGGAGSLSLEQQPCVFTPEGVFENAALVVPLRMAGGLGVRHGWARLTEEPLLVTRVDRNLLQEVNWEPALDVYRQVVEADANVRVEVESFFDVAKGYPFGIFREGEEDIVRDPIAVDEQGGLVCVGEVPPHTVLHVLKGEAGALIAAAEQATQEAVDAEPAATLGLMADCISRTLFLGDRFADELAAAARPFEEAGLPRPLGMLTLGEIASPGDGVLELFNKTMVAAALKAV